MFERFTDRARRCVVLAQEQARVLNHNYIGTEHILLGLSIEGEGVAAKALEAEGVALEDIHSAVRDIIGEGQSPPSGHIPFTPRAKKVLELALREALQLGHNYIGTEHVLLGLLREGEGVAAQVLNRYTTLGDLRRAVIVELTGYGNQVPEPVLYDQMTRFRCVCGWEDITPQMDTLGRKQLSDNTRDHQQTCAVFRKFERQGREAASALMAAAAMLSVEPETFLHQLKYEESA